MAKILIVEDDMELGNALSKWLSQEQHLVELVADGTEGLSRMRVYQYDVIILDWQLPGMTGPDICREYRNQGGHTPILMLTGSDGIDSKAEGLDAGADDYVTKPYHVKELSSRIRALLRRPAPILHSTLKLGTLELNTQTREVKKSGTVVKLLPREFALLEFLMRHPEQVFSPESLLNSVWSSDSESSISTVYTYIKTLRRKIADDSGSSALINVHGVGYKLSLDKS